jgi:hypothetical protein
MQIEQHVCSIVHFSKSSGPISATRASALSTLEVMKRASLLLFFSHCFPCFQARLSLSSPFLMSKAPGTPVFVISIALDFSNGACRLPTEALSIAGSLMIVKLSFSSQKCKHSPTAGHRLHAFHRAMGQDQRKGKNAAMLRGRLLVATSFVFVC